MIKDLTEQSEDMDTITAGEVDAALNSLKANKCGDRDTIHPRFLKKSDLKRSGNSDTSTNTC